MAVCKEDLGFNAEDDVGDNTQGHSTDPRNPTLQKSHPDVDGGSFPEWNSKFVINFKPPLLTSCRVLFTDVMKVLIDDSITYVVIMVREAKDKSIFMTAYDSRTATEYKLIGGPPAWKFRDINNKRCDFPFNECYPNKLKDSRITVFSEELESCISETEKLMSWTPASYAEPINIIKLGDVITPRLLVSIYNQKGASEELLGSCQVSISAVLSGTGTDKIQWTQLMHEYIREDGSSSASPAGAIMLKLGYERGSNKSATVEVEENANFAEKMTRKESVVPTPSPGPKASGRVSASMPSKEPRSVIPTEIDSGQESKSELDSGKEVKSEVPVIPMVPGISTVTVVEDTSENRGIKADIINVAKNNVVTVESAREKPGNDEEQESILQRKHAAPAPVPPEPNKSELSSSSVGQLSISVPKAASLEDPTHRADQPNTFSNINSNHDATSPDNYSRTVESPINYDTMRLPPNWDRRMDPKSGKVRTLLL